MTHAYISKGNGVIKVWLSPDCQVTFGGEYTARNINKAMTEVITNYFDGDPNAVHFLLN